jgi:hypothetical protein
MHSPPKLTIGMAAFDDFDGVYFTLQALRLYHDLREVELIVVDNKPDSVGSESLRKLLADCRHGTAGARYVAAPEVVGTSAPRNRVFMEATGDAVLCIDSHVLLSPGSVARLIDWYDARHDSRDLLSGPMLYDTLGNISTHFVDFWRGEMWGIWGQAWSCAPNTECRMMNDEVGDGPPDASPLQHSTFNIQHFTVLDDGAGRARYVSLEMSHVPLTSLAGKTFPDIPYAGHEAPLSAAGFRPLGFSPDDEFEIPGMGLGLFSCRKHAWLGFNEQFRGFGGEEMYIHEKFRQAGARCLCLGFLKWVHRFGRPGGVKYPLTRWNKVRNYVLGHVELGRPLDEIYEHFVVSGLVPKAEWDSLVEDPTRLMPVAVLPKAPETIEAIYEAVRGKPRDLEKHFPKLRELASKCPRVTEFSKRRETVFALALGNAECLMLNDEVGGGQSDSPIQHSAFSIQHSSLPSLVSYCSESPHDLLTPLKRSAAHVTTYLGDSSSVESVDETDLLFIHSEHTKRRLLDELGKFAPRVTHYIVLGGTAGNGQRGEDGGPGLFDALKEFTAANPEWFVASHTSEQYGLTVLSRLPEDRPAEKIILWPLGFGPGTELSAILASLDINPAPSCDCKGKANQMDIWGVDGCRARMSEIVGWMRDGQGRWGWKDKLHAAAKAVTSGLAFKLDWSDPFPSLIDEAIRRAEGKGKSENAE